MGFQPDGEGSHTYALRSEKYSAGYQGVVVVPLQTLGAGHDPAGGRGNIDARYCFIMPFELILQHEFGA